MHKTTRPFRLNVAAALTLCTCMAGAQPAPMRLTALSHAPAGQVSPAPTPGMPGVQPFPAPLPSPPSPALLPAPLPGAVPTVNPGGAPCGLSLSDNTVDYGRMTRAQVLPNAYQKRGVLGTRYVTLQASCSQPTQIGIALRGAASAEAAELRFGDAGTVRIHAKRAVLDGRPVRLAAMVNGVVRTDGLAEGDAAPMLPNTQIVAVGPGYTPLRGNALAVQLELTPSVPADATRVRSSTDWRADATLEIVPN
jgi:hypothetical protein